MSKALLGLPVLVTFAAAASAAAQGLESIDHVILYMQENRAFDHYFGTLAGVRGFHDPQVQVNEDGKSVFYRKVNSTISLITDHLLPWHINYQNEPGRANATQCTSFGSNSFSNNQAALAAGANDQWVLANTPHSVSYYKREDIPYHYGLADAFTIGDMYQEGVISCTDPNRVIWQTGSINVAGGSVVSTQGPVLDNNDSPGCSALTYTNIEPTLGRFNSETSSANYSCYPYDWPVLQDAGVSWKFYQAQDNFGDNPLLFFSKYQELLASGNLTNPLVVNGLEYQPGNQSSAALPRFVAAAKSGTLPQVSYIVGPAALSEHPPNLPNDGAWYTRQIVDAVMASPKYNSTVLLLSYDETGGTADHVVPFHSPEGTPGEWLINPFTGNSTFSGPGFRLPFLAISPFTRGSNVFTEPADHTSQILFLEKWLGAKGFNIRVNAINEWRREHMSNLVSLFDFSNPDTSPVTFPSNPAPHTTDGYYDGSTNCEETYGPLIVPNPPYGLQKEATALFQEAGFKSVRGAITEGRYLTLESASYALTYTTVASRTKRFTSSVAAQSATPKHNNANQLVILEATDPTLATGKTFKIRFSAAGTTAPAYLDATANLVSAADAATFTVIYQGTSYSIQTSKGDYLSLAGGKVSFSKSDVGFKLFSVTM